MVNLSENLIWNEPVMNIVRYKYTMFMPYSFHIRFSYTSAPQTSTVDMR